MVETRNQSSAMAEYVCEILSIQFLLVTSVFGMHSAPCYCHDYQGLDTDEHNILFNQKSSCKSWLMCFGRHCRRKRIGREYSTNSVHMNDNATLPIDNGICEIN